MRQKRTLTQHLAYGLVEAGSATSGRGSVTASWNASAPRPALALSWELSPQRRAPRLRKQNR